MAQNNKHQPSLGFLEMRAAIDEMKDNLPYMIEFWGVEGESMYKRFEALKAAGFTHKDALEIIKARGSMV